MPGKCTKYTPIKLIGFYHFDKFVKQKSLPCPGRLASVKFEN